MLQPYDEGEDLSSTLTAERPEFEIGEYSGYYNSGPEENNEDDQFLLPDDSLLHLIINGKVHTLSSRPQTNSSSHR